MVEFNEENWCPGTDLNCRHADFQSAALPTELPGHPGHSVKGCPGGRMAPEVVGFIVDIELSVQSRRAANRTLRAARFRRVRPIGWFQGFRPNVRLVPWLHGTGGQTPCRRQSPWAPNREIWKHPQAAGRSGAQWPLRGSFSGSSWGRHHGHKGVGLRPRPGEKGDSGRGLRRRAMAPVDSRGWSGPDRRRPRRRAPTAAPAPGR